MKKVLFIFAVSVVVFGCNNQQKKEEKEKKELAIAIENAQKSSIIETKLFLDFRFGMTESEVSVHLDSLVKIGKVYLKSDYTYQYDFTSEQGIKYFLTFVPNYYNGELYKMSYPIHSSLVYDKAGYIRLFLSFMKNKKDFKRFTTSDISDSPVYTGIKDNMIVTFERTVNEVMIYENAPVSIIVENEDNSKKQDEYKKSSSDF
jgi:hypothetical protein